MANAETWSDDDLIRDVAEQLWRIVTKPGCDFAALSDCAPQVRRQHEAWAVALMLSPTMTAAFRRCELART